MNENFRFSKMSKIHKRNFIIYQIVLFLMIALMTVIAVNKTDPHISTDADRMSFSIGIGAMIGLGVMAIAFMNRLKSLLKVKFFVFLVMWVLLSSLDMVMDTLIWTIGLVLIPLMIDDLIMLPIWRNIWYNNYE